MFCSAFDEALAQGGPAGVFLADAEGHWRFDPSWTRDCWGRNPGPHPVAMHWVVLRDSGSGFVFLALVTSPTLLLRHPRLESRLFTDEAEARACLASFGQPAHAATPWSAS